MWARPSLYLWGLGASGWANSFYSAAVQAGTKSWKAFFFGSSDAANFITVDKPPAALWVMELSARMFGVNAWSILVPQALEGVAAVGLLYASVRRWFGAGAGLLAGAVLALTPVAALMFRFNNPDALLVLLLTAAAYAVVRALEGGRTRWLVLAGSLIGFGFLAKMLQTVLVVPGFGLAYLIAGPVTLRRRILQLLAAGGAMIASAMWWVVAVMAVPASARPYIGGSQNNSLWNLMFGYNGFGRLTGNETGSIGGAATTGSRWGATGLLRMFNTAFGAQSSWLIPAAVVLLAGGLLFTLRACRTDPPAILARALGRVARGDRRGLQSGEGHHPSLLHRGPGSCHRRPGRYRGIGDVAAAPPVAGPCRPGNRPGRHRGLVLPATAPDSGLEPVAPRRCPPRGPQHRGAHRRLDAPARQGGEAGGGGGRPPCAARARGLLG